MIRDKIIEVAASQDGEKENPANSNRQKYGEWYGLNGYAWCAMFVSWVYDQAGAPLEKINTDKGFQHCQSAYNIFKERGRLVGVPQKADIVLYGWGQNGTSTHTGIFVEWLPGEEGSRFYAWEGNTAIGNDRDGGRVMKRVRKASDVKAFVCPEVLGNKGFVLEDNVLKKGAKGSRVSNFQKLLYDLDYTITVDGFFGPKTEEVVKQFQKDNRLTVTGTVTINELGIMEDLLAQPKVSPGKLITGAFYKQGSIGEIVVLIQEALNKKGANPKLVADGVFGTNTKKAVIAFQAKSKITKDGIVGPQTLYLLGIRE